MTKPQDFTEAIALIRSEISRPMLIRHAMRASESIDGKNSLGERYKGLFAGMRYENARMHAIVERLISALEITRDQFWYDYTDEGFVQAEAEIIEALTATGEE